jgi:hypothetical protein
MVRMNTARSALVAALLLGLLALALLATGCGGSTAASPSPSPSASSLAQKLQALKTYATQVTPIYNETSAAVGSLDGAVSGLSKKPDQTWADGATQMTTASTALGTAATDLAAITPPASLQSTQDGVVKALQGAQKVLDTTGAYLSKRVYDPSYPDIKTQIKQQVTDALAVAWTSIFSASGQGTPTPLATP